MINSVTSEQTALDLASLLYHTIYLICYRSCGCGLEDKGLMTELVVAAIVGGRWI